MESKKIVHEHVLTVELKSVLHLICMADTCELVFKISVHLSGNVFQWNSHWCMHVCVFVCIYACGKMGGLESMCSA